MAYEGPVKIVGTGSGLLVRDERSREERGEGEETRDQEPEGVRVGSHASGSRYTEQTDGRLTVHTKDGEHLCTYEPGQWNVVEDKDGVHVHRLGDHDPFAAAGPQEPERIDTGDSMAARLNEANRRFWDRGARTGDASPRDPSGASSAAIAAGLDRDPEPAAAAAAAEGYERAEPGALQTRAAVASKGERKWPKRKLERSNRRRCQISRR
jgi:hypothetical protein